MMSFVEIVLYTRSYLLIKQMGQLIKQVVQLNQITAIIMDLS